MKPVKHICKRPFRGQCGLGTLSNSCGSKASTRYLNDVHSDTDIRHRLTAEQFKVIDSILRVDQAGELAANWIYRGQHSVLKNDPESGPLIQV